MSISGYLLCGTPRTGSTLLCSLLSSTDVLGRPASYFREADEAMWARRLGVPVAGERARDYRAFVRAVRADGTTDNGVFGARIMWGSLERVTEGLRTGSSRSDLALLEQALGPLTMVFLRREDVVGQAVSWSRAEQTGFWQHGDRVERRPRQDLAQLKGFVETIDAHNEAWRVWFDRQGVEPEQVTYEQLVRDPRSVVEAIADRLQVVVPATWRARSPHRRQADRTSAEWAAALRAALAADQPVSGP
jgi:trehalose 2-sulfotransferase